MNTIKAVFNTIVVCGSKFFTSDQYRQIYSGFRWYNLMREQVKVYARKELSIARMSYCKHAIAEGFSHTEMAEWLDLGLNGHVFRYAIEGRMAGIPKEKVHEYARPGISAKESFRMSFEMTEKYRNK